MNSHRRKRRPGIVAGRFPAANCLDCPDEIKCQDCESAGWGPMLRVKVWDKIKPKLNPGQPVYRCFLCEDCMVRRLGRQLQTDDLRDCPMNYKHPLYQRTGIF